MTKRLVRRVTTNLTDTDWDLLQMLCLDESEDMAGLIRYLIRREGFKRGHISIYGLGDGAGPEHVTLALKDKDETAELIFFDESAPEQESDG